MNEEEKRQMMESLQEGRQKLIEALDGVSEQVASASPGPGRWSILECLEHLILAEDRMFGSLKAAHSSAEPVVNRLREKAIRERGHDRTRKVKSPEVAVPTGRYKNLEEARRTFLASRERTMEFVMNCTEDLRAKQTNHPLLGPVNCYETLLLMAAHPLRHSEQIAENRKALNG
jgi:hypothetical protein